MDQVSRRQRMARWLVLQMPMCDPAQLVIAGQEKAVHGGVQRCTCA
jgi:hypothetical protein